DAELDGFVERGGDLGGVDAARGGARQRDVTCADGAHARTAGAERTRTHRRMIVYAAMDRPPPVGTPMPRVDGVAKVTGRARYLDDLDAPGAWFGATVRSTIAHGVLE